MTTDRAIEILAERDGHCSPEEYLAVVSQIQVGDYLADEYTWDYDFRQGRQ